MSCQAERRSVRTNNVRYLCRIQLRCGKRKLVSMTRNNYSVFPTRRLIAIAATRCLSTSPVRIPSLSPILRVCLTGLVA